jgi:hypothetical protein
MARDLRKQGADLESAGAVAAKLERAGKHSAVLVELRALDLGRHGLAREPREQWLGVEGVEVRDAARHVEENHVFRARPEVWRRRSHRPPDRSREQTGQRQIAEAG